MPGTELSKNDNTLKYLKIKYKIAKSTEIAKKEANN